MSLLSFPPFYILVRSTHNPWVYTSQAYLQLWHIRLSIALTKRKGRLAGAVIGTAATAVTLGNPVVGAAVGAAVGTGKKTKGKNNSTTTGTATTTSDNIEVDSYASMKMRNVETNQINTIGFYCSSNIDMQLKSFNISKSSDASENVRNQKTSVELLKDYKELLDSGIITQEEFNQKKTELL